MGSDVFEPPSEEQIDKANERRDTSHLAKVLLKISKANRVLVQQHAMVHSIIQGQPSLQSFLHLLLPSPEVSSASGAAVPVHMPTRQTCLLEQISWKGVFPARP